MRLRLPVKLRQPVAILGVVPTLEVGWSLFGEGCAGFHEIALSTMVVEGGGKARKLRSRRRTHLPHHMHGVHARRRWQGQKMLGHLKCCRQKRIRLHQAIEEADLIEPFGCKTKTERHFHGDWVGQIGKMSVVVAAQ